MFTNAESDGRGAEDMAQDAVVGYFPVFVHPIEQHPKNLYRFLCLVQRPLRLHPERLSLLDLRRYGALFLLRVTLSPRPQALNLHAMSSDPECDRIDEVGESSLAEQEDISRRPIVVVNVVDVGFLRSEEDVITNDPRAYRCHHHPPAR